MVSSNSPNLRALQYRGGETRDGIVVTVVAGCEPWLPDRLFGFKGRLLKSRLPDSNQT